MDYSGIDVFKLIQKVETNCELAKEQNVQNLRLIESQGKMIELCIKNNDRLTLIIEGDEKAGIEGLAHMAKSNKKQLELYSKYVFAIGFAFMLIQMIPHIKDLLKMLLK